MAVLTIELRNKFERTIIEARDVAEAGAKAALEAFAVHHQEPYRHMSPEERKLRNHLRARARQLGDKQNQKGELEITHLVWECAYEHWHRMLFARFLAENDLLIEPEMGVAISLEECEELAKEEKKELWVLASEFAQRMLPQIFRPDNPVLKIIFASEHRLRLEHRLNSLEPNIFKADDSLGWVYQFWQSKESDRIKRSGIKIGANELPARTQLFTQPYMVDFLLQNTLGAWWVGRHGKNSLPIEMPYLRFLKDGKPASGTFDGWPKTTSEIRILDPCCGSGHFLAAAFNTLVRYRMEEENISAKEACDAVIEDNIFGLELDHRCTQIAAFALALAAWKFPEAGGFRKLPDIHIACSGLTITSAKTQWIDLAGNNGKLRNGMANLYELFQNAPVLGSLIDISSFKEDLLTANIAKLRPLLQQAFLVENSDVETSELAVTAKGISYAADILSRKFTLVATNVPYLLAGKQCDFLKSYCNANFNKGDADLATAFIVRCNSFLIPNGTHATVTPLNWLYIKSYKDLRQHLLKETKVQFVARVGAADIAKDSWEILRALTIITNKRIVADYTVTGLEAPFPDEKNKAIALRTSMVMESTKNTMLSNPDSRIVFNSSQGPLLKKFASSIQGMITGDIPRFTRCFWEVDPINEIWRYQQSRVASSLYFGGLEHILMWGSDKGLELNQKSARIQGLSALGQPGIAVTIMRSLPVTLYSGEMFDSNIAVVLPKKAEDFVTLWTFLESAEFNQSVRRIDQKLGVTNATLVKINFDYEHWKNVAIKKYPNGLPTPYSDDPTQWVFHGNPIVATDPLQVATALLLGYCWPAETDKEMKLSPEARTLIDNHKLLDGFKDEDGIVCIPAIRNEEAASARLQALLAASYGNRWTAEKGKKLISDTGSDAHDLDDWLRNDFFAQHCKLFHYRPFLWHIWDGRRDGFQAIVNYHKIAQGNSDGRKLLEALTYSYLGDWIRRQKDGVKRGDPGAEERLISASELQNRLIVILKGEPLFDIFVRWKPIEKQPIGWEPDINDGVRFNIRPFLAQDIPGGRKGAGILRWKPNIKWNKDRGKEPFCPKEQYPWFWKDGEFTGDRVNDVHLHIDEKSRARGKT